MKGATIKADMDGTYHPKYPTIDLIVRIGRPAAALLTALIVVAGAAATLAGYGWPWLVAALVVAPIAFVLMRSYVEFAEVISDILLPR
jgi:4-hydroxybenzoate polyprenyltransferase